MLRRVNKVFESKLACHLVCLFLSTTELPMEEKNTITKIIDTQPCLYQVCTKCMILNLRQRSEMGVHS